MYLAKGYLSETQSALPGILAVGEALLKKLV